MFYNSELNRIIEKYGEEYILRQLAEECAELTQAALKLVRSMKGETPVAQKEANSRFLEEVADVCVMLNCVETGLLCTHEICIVSETAEKKMDRMIERLLGESSHTEQED